MDQRQTRGRTGRPGGRRRVRGHGGGRRPAGPGPEVVIVDRLPPPPGRRPGPAPRRRPTIDPVDLPHGDVCPARGHRRPPHPVAVDDPGRVVATAVRLVPHLRGRRVHLVSTLEVFGPLPGPLTETTRAACPGTTASSEWTGSLPDRDMGRALGAGGLGAGPVRTGPNGVGRTAWPSGPRSSCWATTSGTWTWSLRLANTVGRGQERVLTPGTAGRRRTAVDRHRRHPRSSSRRPPGHVVAHPPPAGTFVVGCPSISLDDLARSIQAIGSDSEMDLPYARGPTAAARSAPPRLDPLGLGAGPGRPVAGRSAEGDPQRRRPRRPPAPRRGGPHAVRPPPARDRQPAVLWTAAKNGQRWSRS